MSRIIDELKRTDHKRYLGGLDFFKYIGPGLLVTVGFIDPGNWASNFAAGSEFGYALLWVVTLSTIMLIVLQHNVAHLGIVTGLCLSEAATQYCPKWISRPILGSAVLASISTSLAEILGGAIALQMLLEIPIAWGSVLTTMFVVIMLFSNSYKKIERAIIAFVSVIGLSFLYELFLVDIDWPVAIRSWVVPEIPQGSMLIIMSVLGAVVMPHNLFLHSEVIQSHEYNKQDESSIRKVLKYEFYDTLFSMIVGWAINSAMILLAAATFFRTPTPVGERINDYDFVQLKNGNGYDHNWVLNTKGDVTRKCASLKSPKTGIVLDVYTNEPGIQVYAGNFLDGSLTGKKGITYNQRASVCLETQKYPDTPNKPEWPSAVLRPGEKYTSQCIFKFSVDK